MRFRHFRNGKTYEFVDLAVDHETLEAVVIYRDQEGFTWTRPARQFFEKVEAAPAPAGMPSVAVPRFAPAVVNPKETNKL